MPVRSIATIVESMKGGLRTTVISMPGNGRLKTTMWLRHAADAAFEGPKTTTTDAGPAWTHALHATVGDSRQPSTAGLPGWRVSCVRSYAGSFGQRRRPGEPKPHEIQRQRTCSRAPAALETRRARIRCEAKPGDTRGTLHLSRSNEFGALRLPWTSAPRRRRAARCRT